MLILLRFSRLPFTPKEDMSVLFFSFSCSQMHPKGVHLRTEGSSTR